MSISDKDSDFAHYNYEEPEIRDQEERNQIRKELDALVWYHGALGYKTPYTAHILATQLRGHFFSTLLDLASREVALDSGNRADLEQRVETIVIRMLTERGYQSSCINPFTVSVSCCW